MKNTIKHLGRLLAFLLLWSNLRGQVNIITADFTHEKREISISPEAPAYCDFKKGVTVKCNEDFDTYRWRHALSGVELQGKEVQITISGEWTLSVSYTSRGKVCEDVFDFEVWDISDPVKIRKYFTDNGFISFNIVRKNPPGVGGDQQSGRSGCQSDAIQFPDAGEDIWMNDVFSAVYAEFPPLRGLTGSAVVTEVQCLCGAGGVSMIPEYEVQYKETGEANAWAHIHFMNNSTLNGFLFLKARLPGDADLPVSPQASRMQSLYQYYLSGGFGSAGMAEKLVKNIFMPHKIGGEQQSYPTTEIDECHINGYYLTAGRTLMKINNGLQNLSYAGPELEGTIEEGVLVAFEDGAGNRYQPFRYMGNNFSGYFDIRTTAFYERTEEPDFAHLDKDKLIRLVIDCNGEKKVWATVLKNKPLNGDKYGGLRYQIADELGIDEFGKCMGAIDNGSDYVSFIAPTGGHISLPKERLGAWFSLQMNLDLKPEEAVGGLLYGFRIFDCDDEYLLYNYDQNLKQYINQYGEEYIDHNTAEVPYAGYMLNTGRVYQVMHFEANDLRKHSSALEENYLEKFSAFTEIFLPFSHNNPISADESILALGWEIDIKWINCDYCPDEAISDNFIKGEYRYNPEHIYVEKIAQLATAFPGYFHDPVLNDWNSANHCLFTFTQYKKWVIPDRYVSINYGDHYREHNRESWPWGQYLTDHPEVEMTYESDKVEFFKVLIGQIKNTAETQLAWWDDIENKEISEIVCHLRAEPQQITKRAAWSDKETALNILYPTDPEANIRNDAEYAIIHLFAASSANEVIDHIEEKTLAYYWNSFNDHLFGDDNKTKLFTLISNKCLEYNAGYFPFMQQFYNDPASLPALEASIWNITNLSFTITNNRIYIYGDNPPYGYTFDYNEIIPVKVTGNFTINVDTHKKGVTLYLPAVQAALYAYSNDNEVAERRNWALLDLGLMTIGVGSYKYVWSTANYLRKLTIAADVIGSVLGLTAQLLDNIDDDTRTKIQLAALVASGPEIGISLIEAISATRLLRTRHATKPYAVSSANEVRLALAKKDLKDFDDAWEFVRTHPRGADAWERFVLGGVDESIRKNKQWLQKLADDLSHEKWGPEIASLLDESPADINIWKALKDNPDYHWELYSADGFTAGSRWEKWSQREFFKAKTQQGTAFESAMLNSIKTRTGSEYNDLRALVTDLDDRLLLKQVQFCLPGFSPPCTNTGEFFVADQVWVKFDANDNIVDMVIVDAKLSQSTAFTPGQNAAKNHVGGKLSYKPNVPRIEDVDGVRLPSDITQGTEIEIKSFYKLYGDGNGNYLGIQ